MLIPSIYGSSSEYSSSATRKKHYDYKNKNNPQRDSAKKVLGNAWFQLTSSHHFINSQRYSIYGKFIKPAKKEKPSSSIESRKPYYIMIDAMSINSYDNAPPKYETIGRCSKKDYSFGIVVQK